MLQAVKSERFQLRLTPETFYRIRVLARHRGMTMSGLIELLIDQAWMDQICIDGFKGF